MRSLLNYSKFALLRVHTTKIISKILYWMNCILRSQITFDGFWITCDYSEIQVAPSELHVEQRNAQCTIRGVGQKSVRTVHTSRAASWSVLPAYRRRCQGRSKIRRSQSTSTISWSPGEQWHLNCFTGSRSLIFWLRNHWIALKS